MGSVLQTVTNVICSCVAKACTINNLTLHAFLKRRSSPGVDWFEPDWRPSEARCRWFPPHSNCYLKKMTLTAMVLVMGAECIHTFNLQLFLLVSGSSSQYREGNSARMKLLPTGIYIYKVFPVNTNCLLFTLNYLTV